jgi:putative ABC transport system permease protein
MLHNYFLVGLRALRRHPGYTSLNIIGLGVGMAVCLLVGLYVHDEMQVDRFHENAERIVQMGFESPWWGRGLMSSYPLATVLANDVPGVERAVRVNQANLRLIREATGHEQQHLTQLTEPNFPDIFSFPALHGDPAAALASPDGLVLTESVARAFFGNEDPIGQRLGAASHSGTHDLVVRAVVRDVPAGSTIQFDALAPLTLLPSHNA